MVWRPRSCAPIQVEAQSAAGRDRDAVLQPPKPGVVPSARVLAHRAAETTAGHAEPERG
jgi:hypothetical protein